MSYNSPLKYRTFDELLTEAKTDFKKYDLQGIIDPQELIKVVKRVNKDLGLRINQTKEKILEIEKGRVRLPNDFYILDFALVLDEYESRSYQPQGTHIQEKIIGGLPPVYQQAPPAEIDFCADIVVNPSSSLCPQCGGTLTDGICNPCCSDPSSCKLTCNGNVIQLVQQTTATTRFYKRIYPLHILQNTEDLNDVCPNLYWESDLSGVIRDGWLQTSFTTGKVYLNYQGYLENEKGELLVPDHDLLNEYYEYALKQRILENLIMNDEEVNPNKLQLIEQRYRAARNTALTVVNTPNFGEMQEFHRAKRNAMYSKYYDMFAKSPRLKL